MKTEKFLVAGGNPTRLVWGCQPDKQSVISLIYLGSRDAEQVGFIDDEHGVTYLTMMGHELCINATLALSSVSKQSGKFFTRGIDTLVSYANSDNDWTTVELRLPFKQEGKTILFDGIGYRCYEENVTVTRKKIIELAKQYDLPAFGIIICKDNTITPHIYVEDTGTLIHESACGSGSIAASIILGAQDIIQPSGEVIKVKRKGDIFTVSAQVWKIPDFVSDLGGNVADLGGNVKNRKHAIKDGTHIVT